MNQLTKERYVFLSNKEMDLSLFNPIENIPLRNKPRGGIWSSPVNCNRKTWKEYIAKNEFFHSNYTKATEFAISSDSKILVIKTKRDVDNLPDQEDEILIEFKLDDYKLPDFEKLAKSYDAIKVEINEETYISLFGWDVETLLILNPEIIIPSSLKVFSISW